MIMHLLGPDKLIGIFLSGRSVLNVYNKWSINFGDGVMPVIL